MVLDAERANRNIQYERAVFFIFVARTIVLGLALFKGPYFLIDEARDLKIFSVFLDIINIFQLLFMYSVIEKKNLFQFMLYIPLLIYALLLVIILILRSYQIPGYKGDTNLYIAVGFLYAYAGILVVEGIIHIFMYRRLKNDFKWTNFKKIGVNPAINEAFKRREQFDAVRRFSIMYLCSEVINFGVSFRSYFLGYSLTVSSLIIIFFMVCVFPNEEIIWQRRALLAFIVICTGLGLAYVTLEIIFYFVKEDGKKISVLEDWFYVFNMVILFISAFRDYQMFGSGLKEYYCERSNDRRRNILFTR